MSSDTTNVHLVSRTNSDISSNFSQPTSPSRKRDRTIVAIALLVLAICITSAILFSCGLAGVSSRYFGGAGFAIASCIPACIAAYFAFRKTTNTR